MLTAYVHDAGFEHKQMWLLIHVKNFFKADAEIDFSERSWNM